MDEILLLLKAFTKIWNHKLITIAGVKLGLGNIVMALTFLLFSARISHLISKIILKKIIVRFVPDKSAQTTYQTFTFYAALGGVVSLSLTIAGIPLTIFTVIGGALAIGVGFGSQNIVNNFISGVIILIEKPIRVGDIVEVEGITGVVTSIGTRSAKIRNIDRKVFVVPNSFFLEKGVTNWTYETNVIRTTLQFGVAYGVDAEVVKNISLGILKSTPGVEILPSPVVQFHDFADSNLLFQLVFYCDLNKINTMADVKSDIRFALNEQLKLAAIPMAFPQRDLNINQKEPLAVKVMN